MNIPWLTRDILRLGLGGSNLAAMHCWFAGMGGNGAGCTATVGAGTGTLVWK